MFAITNETDKVLSISARVRCYHTDTFNLKRLLITFQPLS
jgi:hypothetical protein